MKRKSNTEKVAISIKVLPNVSRSNSNLFQDLASLKNLSNLNPLSAVMALPLLSFYITKLDMKMSTTLDRTIIQSKILNAEP